MQVTNTYPTNLAMAPDASLDVSLDRLAYAALWLLVCLVWAEATELATWTGMLVVGVTAIRTAKIRQIRRLTTSHGCMAAFVIWIALSLIWTVDWDSTVARLATFVQLLVLVWLIWELAVTESRIRGLLLAYLVGSIFASCLTVYNYLTGYTAAKIAADHGINKWETSRYTIAGLNENDLGLMLAFSIPIVFYLLVSCKGAAVHLLCWLQLVTGTTAILLTSSRGAATSAVVGFAMFPLTVSRLHRRQRAVSLAAGAALLACGAYLVPASAWSRIFELGSEISEGTMTHRTVLWAAGMDAFRNHAFLGVGAGAYGASIVRVVDIPYVAHNTYLSVLVELGVAGAILLLTVLASILYCVSRMPYFERCLWTTLLLTWIVGVSALTWEYRKPTWLLFGLALAHVYKRQAGQHEGL